MPWAFYSFPSDCSSLCDLFLFNTDLIGDPRNKEYLEGGGANSNVEGRGTPVWKLSSFFSCIPLKERLCNFTINEWEGALLHHFIEMNGRLNGEELNKETQRQAKRRARPVSLFAFTWLSVCLAAAQSSPVREGCVAPSNAGSRFCSLTCAQDRRTTCSLKRKPHPPWWDWEGAPGWTDS